VRAHLCVLRVTPHALSHASSALALPSHARASRCAHALLRRRLLAHTSFPPPVTHSLVRFCAAAAARTTHEQP
jgi:hypothetical protein